MTVYVCARACEREMSGCLHARLQQLRILLTSQSKQRGREGCRCGEEVEKGRKAIQGKH